MRRGGASERLRATPRCVPEAPGERAGARSRRPLGPADGNVDQRLREGPQPPSALCDIRSREQEIISVQVSSTLMKQLLYARQGGESKIEKTQTLLSKGLVASGDKNRVQGSMHPRKTNVEPHCEKLPFIWASAPKTVSSPSPPPPPPPTDFRY